MPPPLRDAAYHDLALLSLADCDPPILLVREGWESGRGLPYLRPNDALDVRSTGGTYRWGAGGYETPLHFVVLDLPHGYLPREFRVHLSLIHRSRAHEQLRLGASL